VASDHEIEMCMRHLLLVLPLLLVQMPAAQAQVSVGIGVQLPGISIGINLPVLPQLVRVPGYPVYYAPQAPANYFFYDGLYWVFQGDEWYASDWYNGPWRRVGPDYVPLYVLRVPVQYYRLPPPYFRSWRADAPPRWGEHWGQDWEQRRPGWDRWDRRYAPAPAPLPDYQRKYPQSRYPQEPAQQQSIRSDHYRYQPRDPAVRQLIPQYRQQYQQQPGRAPAPQAVPQDRGHDAGRAEPSNRGQDKKGNAGDPGRDDDKGKQGNRDNKGNQGGKGGG